MKRRIFQHILRWKIPVVCVAVAMTVFFVFQLPDLRIVTTLESLVPHDEVYRDDQALRSRFDISDRLVVGLFHPESVLSREVLTYASEVNDRIERLDGVSEVKSIFTQTNIRSREEGLDLSRLCRSVEDADLERLRGDLRAFREVHGILISEDLRCLPFIVELDPVAPARQTYRRIQSSLDTSSRPDGCTTRVSGPVAFEAVLGENIFRDLLVMIPVATVIMCVALLLIFRSVGLALIAIVEIAIVNVWTLGLMAVLGQPLYVIGATTPVILVALSLADEIHIFAEYRALRRSNGADRRENITGAMAGISLPIVQTSLTTALGFLSFLASSMPPLKTFGAFTAVGVVIAMIFSLVLTPILLDWLRPVMPERLPWGDPEAALAKTGLWVHGKRKTVFVLAALILVGCLVALSRLRLQDSWTANFSRQSRILKANRALNDELLGTMTVYVEADTGQRDGIYRPAFMRGLARVQEEIEAIEGVGGTLSVSDMIKKMNLELQGESRIPDSRLVIAQYFLLLQDSSYTQFWDFHSQAASIAVFLKVDDYRSGIPLFARLPSSLENHLPGASVRYGGEYMLQYHWVDLLPGDQIGNLLLSLALIFLACLLFTMNPRNACLLTLPVAASVATIFGALGAARIDFGVAASVFSSIVIGIGIDYAIHMHHKGTRHLAGHPLRVRIERTYATTGKAIVFDACVMVAGFLVLLISRTPPIQKMGGIVSLGMSIALVWTIVLAPFIIEWSAEANE